MPPCYRDADDENAKVNKQISQGIRKEDRERAKTKPVKLLLLGAGDSGKSTLAKQMKILYLNGYTEEERKTFIPIIQGNVLVNIKDILKGIQRLKLALPPHIQEAADYICGIHPHQSFTPDLVEKMKEVLNTPELMKLLKKSAELQAHDHLEYMFGRLELYANPNYVPSDDDILRTRVRTTGIMEITYPYENFNFTVIDMGGQRSERRKWIFFFENVTAVVFVLALNEYDMRLREDPSVNRMHESLDLFKNVINNKYLKDTSIILFLNKMDLFQEKITRSDLKVCFPDYAGPPEYEPALKFISEKFKSFDMNQKRNIFIHPTCATNTNNIRTVLADVKLTLIQKVLQDIGILM